MPEFFPLDGDWSFPKKSIQCPEFWGGYHRVVGNIPQFVVIFQVVLILEQRSWNVMVLLGLYYVFL